MRTSLGFFFFHRKCFNVWVHQLFAQFKPCTGWCGLQKQGGPLICSITEAGICASLKEQMLSNRKTQGTETVVRTSSSRWQRGKVNVPGSHRKTVTHTPPCNFMISLWFHPIYKEKQSWAREMAFVEDQSPVSDTHVWWFEPVTSAPGNLSSSSGLREHWHTSAHIYAKDHMQMR